MRRTSAADQARLWPHLDTAGQHDVRYAAPERLHRHHQRRLSQHHRLPRRHHHRLRRKRIALPDRRHPRERHLHHGELLMRAPARPSRAGFTLIEMVVVIVVIGILAKLITPVALASMRANADILDVATTVDKARLASDRIAFEMRELTSSSITAATTTSLTFSRTDYTGTTTTRTVTIDQFAPAIVVTDGVSQNMCNGILRLNYSLPVISPAYTPTLTDQLCSLAFAYYDQTGGPPATFNDIRYIDVTVALRPAAGSQQYSQRTRVALRNH